MKQRDEHLAESADTAVAEAEVDLVEEGVFPSTEGADKLLADEEAGILRNVPLLGQRSPSRHRTYPDEVMRAAVSLFEGVPYYADRGFHTDPTVHPPPEAILGQVTNPRFAESEHKIKGDIIPLNAERRGFLFSLSKMPQVAGNSPRMAGKVRRQGGEEIVQVITQVRAVDLVSAPGTLKGLHESESPSNEGVEEMELKDLTAEQLAESRPDLVQAIKTTAETDKDLVQKVGRLEEEAKALRESKAEADKKLDDLETKAALAERKALATRLLAESELPEVAITEHFRGLVEAAETEEAMKATITDRKELVESQKGPQSTERPLHESTRKGGKKEKPTLDGLKALILS